MGDVRYCLFKDIEEKRVQTEDLPFLKRIVFQDEQEYRIIYQSKSENEESRDVEIDLGCIDRITLSPFLHRSLEKALVGTIKSIEGCKRLAVNRSQLLESARWRGAIGEISPHQCMTPRESKPSAAKVPRRHGA
jgi:hypothetical protein